MAQTLCFGCFSERTDNAAGLRHYLPQIKLQGHTTIQSTVSRTKLTQRFVNDTSSKLSEVQYTFPLYDGVSIVAFKCTIGDRVLVGTVKEKSEARAEYNDAVLRGTDASLLEQMHEASDVFSTHIGSIPQHGSAVIELEYVGELKHDTQLDGLRFSLPTSIAPRYGTLPVSSQFRLPSPHDGSIELTIDVETDENSHIEGISSPSHPIAVTLGRTSTHRQSYNSSLASATLSLGTTELGRDFVLVVHAQDHGAPKALLEQHADIPNHRALMATLVPKFNLPDIHPEIVFVVDRSGSMNQKMHTLISALKIFLKSLPLSAKFNICSFGSMHTFMFERSRPYDQHSMEEALGQVNTFGASFGGTEMLEPLQQTIQRRLGRVPLEIMLLTDGQVFNGQELFDLVNESAKQQVRVFTLGIGAATSTSLIEGVARAGRGFAQFVQDTERMDACVVRMLKGALSPHIEDYRLEIIYDDHVSDEGEFEMVEKDNTMEKQSATRQSGNQSSLPPSTPISLFDQNFQEKVSEPPAGRYDHLPSLTLPTELQAPYHIGGIFSFSRTCVYMLLPNSIRTIKSCALRGTCDGTPVELEIPVQNVGHGKTIHQLAAKKAMLDTEEGRGWLASATGSDGSPLSTIHHADWERIVEREAVRLGVMFQVPGKFCSFVAIDKTLSSPDVPIDGTEAVLPHRFSSKIHPKQSPRPRFGSLRGDCARALRPAQSVRRTVGSYGAHIQSSSQLNPPMVASGRVRGHRSHSLVTSRLVPCSLGAESIGDTFTNSTTAYELPTALSTVNRVFNSSSLPGQVGGSDVANFSTMTVQSGDTVSFNESMGVWPKPPPNANFATPQQCYSRPSSMNMRTPTSSELACQRKMHQIIGLQRFDGSWPLGNALLDLVFVSPESLQRADLRDVDDAAKATVLAIMWLEQMVSDQREVWEILVDKARAWLTTHGGITDVEGLIGKFASPFLFLAYTL